MKTETRVSNEATEPQTKYPRFKGIFCKRSGHTIYRCFIKERTENRELNKELVYACTSEIQLNNDNILSVAH